MDKMIQYALQYLIIAEISFLPYHVKRYMKLQGNHDKNSVDTQSLTKKNDFLSLNFEKFSLEWRRNDQVISEKPLHFSRHYENVRWIEIMAIEAKITKAYDFESYTLYNIFDPDFLFKRSNYASSTEIINNIEYDINTESGIAKLHLKIG